MKKVLVFGTFDLLHPGHRYFLKEARKKGDRLIAVVSRDSFVRSYKNKEPLHNEDRRLRQLLDSGLADEAVLADPEPGTYHVLERVRPDVICLGHDQLMLKADLEQWLDAYPFPVQICVLPPWRRDLYSSTRLKKELQRSGQLSPAGGCRLVD